MGFNWSRDNSLIWGGIIWQLIKRIVYEDCLSVLLDGLLKICNGCSFTGLLTITEWPLFCRPLCSPVRLLPDCCQTEVGCWCLLALPKVSMSSFQHTVQLKCTGWWLCKVKPRAPPCEHSQPSTHYCLHTCITRSLHINCLQTKCFTHICLH